MEVLFAVVILSIATMGVMGVLTFGIVSADTAGNISTATQLSREMVENIRVNEEYRSTNEHFPEEFFSDEETDRVALNDPPFDNDNQYSVFNDPRFTRNIQIARVPGENMDRIRVRVFWEQNGTEKTAETVAFQRVRP